MGFDAFRKNGEPTIYPGIHRPWHADLIVSGLIFCFVITAISFYVILCGSITREKIYSFIRFTVSMFIGAVILTTNYSSTWDEAEISTRTKYKAGTGAEINVTIGVYIGFRGVNITLKGDKDQIEGETINYNEHFSWVGFQGRLGFGPFAGQFNQDYREAQFKGLPLPILWVAEYFTLDGEGIRWGRHYRQAGWYSHIMLWLAFPLWIVTNVLILVLLRYGSIAMLLTGLSMVIANIIWATHRNYIELRIPFTEHDVLEFSLGNSFWVCLITGLTCILNAVLIIILDFRCSAFVTKFFGVDSLQDEEQIQHEGDDSQPTVVNARDNSISPSSPCYYEDTEIQTPQPTPEEPMDDIYSQASLQSPTRNNPSTSSTSDSIRHRERLRMDTIRIPVYAKPSFRSPNHRLTRKFQLPRRKEAPLNSEYYSIASRSSSTNFEMTASVYGYANKGSEEVVDEEESLYSN